jgi:hypothetical protein
VTKTTVITDRFIYVAQDLEGAGLLWHPEVGDEVAERDGQSPVAILVDPQGMTPDELRAAFLWLPTVEQMILQFEARQAVLFHAGLEFNEKQFCYKTVARSPDLGRAYHRKLIYPYSSSAVLRLRNECRSRRHKTVQVFTCNRFVTETSLCALPCQKFLTRGFKTLFLPAL